MRTRDKIKASFYTLIFISITATSYGNFISFYSFEIDVTTYVSRFIDGDSFKIPGDEVRLADVSAPEWNEPGGERATNALHDLLAGETIYLDTDQKTGRGPYGRLIAVIYVKHDPTRYKNVNKALLNQGVVDLTDYTNNEFNPSEWRLYVSTLTNQDKIKFLSISAGLGFIVCLLFHYSIRKISNLVFRVHDEVDKNIRAQFWDKPARGFYYLLKIFVYYEEFSCWFSSCACFDWWWLCVYLLSG